MHSPLILSHFDDSLSTFFRGREMDVGEFSDGVTGVFIQPSPSAVSTVNMCNEDIHVGSRNSRRQRLGTVTQNQDYIRFQSLPCLGQADDTLSHRFCHCFQSIIFREHIYPGAYLKTVFLNLSDRIAELL